LTMTPPKSPHMSPLIFSSHSKDTQQTGEQSVVEQRDSYVFSPPAIVRTSQTTDAGRTSGRNPPDSVSTPSTDFVFSPPLTRSMIKRRSLDVSILGKSSANYNTPNLSVTNRSLR
jgi:hypothetical protein